MGNLLQPLPLFHSSHKGLLEEESELPMVCASDEFNLNAYKLTKKFDYDFSKPTSLGHVVEAKPYELKHMKEDTR